MNNRLNNKLKMVALSGIFALAFLTTKPAMADESNKRTEFQFSGPVEIPGKVLSAGRYVFQVADSSSDRDIVEIFSEDSNGNESVVAIIPAIPDHTPDTPDKPVVHMEERHSGAPEAIQSWFYPGENTGWEFVYPGQ
jgi:hypothetical protein